MGLLRKIEGNTPAIRETVKLPVFYFLQASALASWQSLYNVHLDNLGYKSFHIGLLNAIFIATSAIVVPFWGILADKYGNNRVLLLLTAVCAIMVFLIGKTIAFNWMLVLIAVISIFHQPGGAIIDGMAMGFVRANPSYSYGQFRLWASGGYAIGAIVSGIMAKNDSGVIFNLAAMGFLLVSLFNLFTLPPQPVKNRNLVNFKSFEVFFKNRTLFIFLFIIFLYGIAISPLHQFINLYYKDIGANNTFVGLVFFIQAGFELPTFLLAVYFIKRSRPEKIILFAMAVSGLRMLMYGLIHDPQVAIFFSVFHGITIAFFLVGVVEYVQAHTPDHLRTTGQALIWAFHFGAGVTVGNLILGYLRDQTGMLKAMQIHALGAAVVVVGAMVFFYFTSGKRNTV